MENNREISQIKEEVAQGKSWKFRVEGNIMRTNEGKIWIPKDNRQEMI